MSHNGKPAPQTAIPRPASIPAETDSIENADIEASSEDYARRFAGAVGSWLLETQTRITLSLLSSLPPGASILDVGGGHAQTAPRLIEAGYAVTVVGSDPVCGARLQQWISTDRCRFEVASLRNLPYASSSFDAVVCLRLLPHSVSWTALIGELCRVAARSVVVDYPSARSVNVASSQLYALKRAIEVNTRRYRTFSPHQIASAFDAYGYAVQSEQPQFLLPMVLHRWVNHLAWSKASEAPGRWLGLTRKLGSPVIVRADRQGLA